MSLVVDTLVEGLLDESVARKLITHCGHTPGDGFGKNGIAITSDSVIQIA